MARGPGMKHVVAFNAGEWSPKLDARIDLEKYNLACLQLQNFTLLPYGGAVRRPGTQFIAEAKYHDKKCRLIEFEFSTTTTFTLELGEGYLRFYSNGGQILDGTTPYEVTDGSAQSVSGETNSVPWVESELFQIQYVQINDVMYLCHPNWTPHKLTRISNAEWEIDPVVFDKPPFLDENITTTTLASSVTAAAATGNLVASANLFESSHVGSYWELRHLREGDSIEFALTANESSSSLTILGDWEVRSYGNWGGDVLLERSFDGGSTWETIRKYLGDYDRNIESFGTQDEEALFRITFENRAAPPTGTTEDGRIVIEAVDSFISGVVRVDSYTSPTQVGITVIDQLEATSATEYWSEGSFSDKRGFPRAISIYEQRLVFGGTSHQPQTVFGSVIGDYENFRKGTNDDDSFQYTLGSQERNQIEWLVSQNQLLIGTSGGEWSMGSGTTDSPLTPSNVIVKRQSTYGSKALQAKVINEVVLMVQRNGRKVREVVFSFERDGYVAPDLTLLAEHITEGGITQTAYQQQPDSIFWCVTGDGNLVGMTYERDQNVVGWHRQVTDGLFESVAVVYGSGNDEIWVTVNRTIGGSTKRYIERFNPTEWTDKEDAFYVDSGLSYDGSPQTTFSGLDHLEGKTVQILADGAVEPDEVVSGGSITIENASSVVHVGLGYESIIQPMKLDVDGSLGPSQGQVKQVRQIVVRLLNSLGLKWSDGEDEYDEPFRDTADEMDASPPLFTGEKTIDFGGPFNNEGEVILKQTAPLPSTILALVIKYRVTGN